MGVGESVAVTGLDDFSVALKLSEKFAEGLGADAALLVENGEGERDVGVSEGIEDLLFGRGARRHGSWRLLDKTESELVIGSLQDERQVGLSLSGAMLDCERELVVSSTKVEIGVSPGVELGATAEGLASAKMLGGLSGVVDEDDGEMESSL